MRRLVLLVPLALTGCASTPPAVPVVQRVSPQQAANALAGRMATVETCDGQTHHGRIRHARGDSLGLRSGLRLSWTNLRAMTETTGQTARHAGAVLVGGAVLTGLAAVLVHATGEPCGPGCDRDRRAANVGAALVFGGLFTLFAAAGTSASSATRVRFEFACGSPAPEVGRTNGGAG